jgi:hypothetical protein
MNFEALRKLVVGHPLAKDCTTPVYALDTSVWPRCDAQSRALSAGTTITLLLTRQANP